MQVLLHLIKQELLAHRTLIVAWVAVQIAQSIFAITGMAGEFYRPLTSPLTEQAMMLFGVVHAIGIVLLPGAIALSDPPTDESAHWRALPVQAWQLLTTKLATVFIGVILPILCGQMFSLIYSDAGQWTADLLADQSGYLPAWIGVGFCLGAVAGDRRRFAIAIASLLVGTSLLMFVVHASSQHSHAAGRFEIAMMLLDDGLSNVFTNNLFLIGAGATILLRYFTRIHGAWLAVIFVLGVPATPLIAPRLLSGFIPALHLSTQTEIAEVRASYDPPERILIVTNNAGVRWQGYSPYSALHFHGVGPSQFVMPTKLETHLWIHNEERTSF
ncbi:MAG: hypothetical protein ISQ14_14170, partial [Verrucomicrobiae bacterium]|nr:hypothetical protein [Verrucomicrobiae bacterium]